VSRSCIRPAHRQPIRRIGCDRRRPSNTDLTSGGPPSRSGPPPLSSNSLPRPSLPGGPDLTLNRSTRPLWEG